MKQFYTFLAAVLLTAISVAQVGINNDNPDPSAALDIVSTTGGLLVPRMKETERDGITATQGLIIFCTDCASGEGELQVKLTSSWISLHDGGDVNDPPPAPLAIGDLHQGGIVFYLDGNGGGLIAAPSNQSSGSNWYTAISLCSNLTLGGYSDWFLPSKDELNLMYLNIGQGNTLGLGNVGNFDNNFYWSSTEAEANGAWSQYFYGGSQFNDDKYYSNNVRAVRAF